MDKIILHFLTFLNSMINVLYVYYYKVVDILVIYFLINLLNISYKFHFLNICVLLQHLCHNSYYICHSVLKIVINQLCSNHIYHNDMQVLHLHQYYKVFYMFYRIFNLFICDNEYNIFQFFLLFHNINKTLIPFFFYPLYDQNISYYGRIYI